MKQENLLLHEKLVEENQREILDIFNWEKDDIKWALDNLFSGWLSNPFKIDYSKKERQNHFEFYLALKKQVDLLPEPAEI